MKRILYFLLIVPIILANFIVSPTFADDRVFELSNYHGPEIEFENDGSPLTIYVEGDNVIDSTSDFGLKLHGSQLCIRTKDFKEASLTINVSTETDTAVGIVTDNFCTGNNLRLTINVSSAVPENVETGANVAGIVADQVAIDESTELVINNPTGNYAIFTERLYTATWYLPDEEEKEKALANYIGDHIIINANYKITNGVGDLIPNNTFRRDYFFDDNTVNVRTSAPSITYYETKTETSGNFNIVFSADPVSAKVDTEITSGDTVEKATSVLLSSAEKVERKRPTPEPSVISFYDISQFDISKEDSEIIDLLSQAPAAGTIQENGSYALKLAFKAITPYYTFVHYNNQEGGMYTYAYINDKTNSARVRESAFLEHFLVPLTIALPYPSSDEPKSEEPEEPSEPEEISDDKDLEETEESVLVPKAPNTGVL